MIVGSRRRHGLYVLAFLLPNLLGFLVFVAGPMLGSFAMSLTDLSLTKHNTYSDTPVQFVGLDNYVSVLAGGESERFWRYLGNTLYLMLGVPLAIAGSLGAALLITAKIPPTRARSKVSLSALTAVLTVVVTGAVWLATWPGSPPAEAVVSAELGLGDMTTHEVARLRSIAATLATAGVGVLAVMGLTMGSHFFRTTFYLPSLLAGVPMFMLWKVIYRPDGGLVNAALDPVLDAAHWLVSATPGWMWQGAGVGLALAATLWAVRLVAVGIGKLRHRDAGILSFFGRLCLVATMLATALGLGALLVALPELARASTEAGHEGFEAPAWLVSVRWAKPALVIMGVWLAAGGTNMLLYIAGISNIPPELYEAADIDGAGPWQRFINVTWPQLAPTTFFIVIISTIGGNNIGGLQGGFEQALIMTEGKYETTVLIYYIYNLAFTDEFQLGVASAVAWVLFAIIFGLTLLNYRVGGRLTND